MARLRYAGLKTLLGSALTNSATSITFSAPLSYYGGLGLVPDVAAPSYLPLSLLDPNGLVTEIVYLTAYDHTAGTGTIRRGMEGSAGAAHASGAIAVCGPTPYDLAPFDVTTYGALGDGTTDDTAAINAAIADLNDAGAGSLYFPAGQYKCTDELDPITAHAHIYGEGGGDLQGQNAASGLHFNSTTGYLMTLAGDGTVLENLGFENPTATTQTAGAGVRVTQGDRNTYRNVTVRGFYDCIDIEDGALWHMSGCYLVGPVHYALLIEHVDLPDGGDMVVDGNWFYAATRDATAAVKYVTGGGLKFSNNKINTLFTSGYFNRGLDADIGSTTAVLLVWGNSIENVTNEAIACQGDLIGSTIFGNEIGYYSSPTVSAITVNGWNSISVVSNSIFCTGSSAAPAVAFSNHCINVVVGLNAWHNFDAEYDLGDSTQTTTLGAGGGVSSLGDLSDVDFSTPPTDGQTMVYDAASSTFVPADPPGGVTAVVAGTGISVDSTDPANPVVTATGGGGGSLDSVVAGTGISIDDTDPANPVISATGGGGGGGPAFPLDTVPGSPATEDDEFTSGTLDAKWDLGANSACTIDTVAGVAVLVPTAGSLHSALIAQDAPTGDFTIAAKFSFPRVKLNDTRPGIFVAESGSGKVMVLGIDASAVGNVMNIAHANYSEASDWGAYDGTYNTTGDYGAYTGGMRWYKMVWDHTAKTISFYVSMDGYRWAQYGSAFNASAWTQPDRMGLVLDNNSANLSPPAEMAIDWFRRLA